MSLRERTKVACAEGRRAYRRALRWVVRNVPPGVRTLLGLLLMLGGVFAFLPVLGLWMLPLGVGIVLLDVTVLRRWLRGRRTRRSPKKEASRPD